MAIRNLSVYLGSRSGNDPAFESAARHLGAALTRHGFTVIYGGANIGTMKALADGVLVENGQPVGVMPHELIARGRAYSAVRLIPAQDMRERKRIMEQMSDACIILPGSIGTMDELFDYAVHFQLGYHRKPIFILDTDGFYAPLDRLLDNMQEKGFLLPETRENIRFYPDPDSLLRAVLLRAEQE